MTRRCVSLMLGTSSLFAMASVAAAQPTTQSPDATATALEANEQAAAEGDGEEIVIMARRRAENVQNVPQKVDVVTGNTIAELNIQKFEDIQTIVPGLNMSSGSNGYSTAATIRGAAFNVESTASPTVEFYLNEAHIESIYLFQSMFDIGQVEVLRGPQGTLRGRSSPSGSITATTKRPDLDEFGGYLNFTGTSEGGLNGNGAINIPIISDVLAIRLAGLVDENDGDEVRSINNNLNPFTRTWAGRASLRFEPTDFLAINLMWQHLERKQLAFNQVESISIIDPTEPVVAPIIRAEDRLGITDGPNDNKIRQDIVVGNVDIRFAGQKLSYVGSWSDQTIRQTNDLDLGNAFTADQVFFANSANTGLPFGRSFFGQIQTSKSTEKTHEIRLSSEERLFGMVDYTVGAFFYKLTPPTDLINQSALVNDVILFFPPFVPVPTPFTIVQGPLTFRPGLNIIDTAITRRAHKKEESIFGNVNLHFGDATELSAGARHIWYKDDSLLQVSGMPDQTSARQEEATVYNVSLSHRFSDNFMVYANTGSSWRAGPSFVGIFRPLTPRLTQFTQLPSEKAKSYELGFKSTLLDKRLRFNVTAFHQDFNNYIYRGVPVWFVDIGSAGPQVAQFPLGAGVDAKVDGVEVEAGFQVTPEWNIDASFSYAKSRMKDGIIPCTDLNSDGIPDTNPAPPTLAQLQASVPVGEAVAQCTVTDPISLAPKWSLTVQSEYARPISPAVDGFVRGLFYYYPKNRQDPYNNYDNVGSYGLLNLYAGIRSNDGAWEVSLFGKNILNNEKVLGRNASVQGTTFTQLSGTAPIPGVTSASTTFASSYLGGVRMPTPREFGLNVRYAFGSR